MEGPIIRIRFDGGDADKNTIDMRQLGEALVGIDRIMSDGLIAIFGARIPKKGERAPLTLKAKEPQAGSYELVSYFQEAAAMLPLGMPILAQCGPDLLWDWFKAVIYRFSGRRDLAEVALETIERDNRDHLAARDKADQRTHEERIAYIEVLRQTLLRLGPAAAQSASPVGRSVRRLGVSSDKHPPFVVDEPTADALRQYGGSEFGDLQEMILRTDGFNFHTRRLVVHHPERSGYINAAVLDPSFGEESNPYTLAATRKALIRVIAKPGYREGNLEEIYILDFRGEIDEAA
jgi:hypothetical protein